MRSEPLGIEAAVESVTSVEGLMAGSWARAAVGGRLPQFPAVWRVHPRLCKKKRVNAHRIGRTGSRKPLAAEQTTEPSVPAPAPTSMIAVYHAQDTPPWMVHCSRRIRSMRRPRLITRSVPRSRKRSRLASTRADAEDGLAEVARVSRWVVRMTGRKARMVPSPANAGLWRFAEEFRASDPLMLNDMCSRPARILFVGRLSCAASARLQRAAITARASRPGRRRPRSTTPS